MNFYKSAALALDHLEKHQGSVKGSLAAAGVNASGGEAKRILALVIETLKYRPILLQLLTTVPLLTLERPVFPKKTPPHTPSSQSLLLVLLHDLLFSPRGRIEASDKWPPKPAVMRHQARLKAELVRVQIREGKGRKEELAKSSGEGEGVRYIRWNPNAGRSLAELEAHLAASPRGFTRLDEAVYPVPSGSWFMDPHLPEVLLAFPGGANWWVGDAWYEGGGVVLQDKASCMPARVLMEGWEEGEGECLDATAAPGNKTSYVSALMGNRGKLHAFERSPNRFKTLEKMLAKAKCENVNAQRADFTDSNPEAEEFGNVTRILLDPSCSGSGIVNRLDYLVDDDVEESDSKAERLEKLAGFQLQMILHAFKFPSAKRIVYSTCSIHAEEDERVVMAALQSPVAKARGWGLAPRESVIPTWERRGRPEEMEGDEELANGVIRCLPEDKTNGFFVSCFVRGEGGLRPEVSKKTSKKRALKRARGEAEAEGESEAPEVDSTVAKNEDEGSAEDAEDDVVDDASAGAAKEKTAAQVERARRKKAQQKAKRRKVGAM